MQGAKKDEKEDEEMEEADKEETGSSKMPSDDEIKDATMELLKGRHCFACHRAPGLLSSSVARP